MGRVRTRNPGLPPGLRARVQKSGKTYFYLDLGGKPRREKPLGDDYVLALREWAGQSGGAVATPGGELTFGQVAERYKVQVLPKKAPRTQRDYLRDLKKLLEFFDDPPATLAEILPKHVALYRDHRGTTHSTQEIALFSAIFNWARELGFTDAPNPATGITRNRAKGRDRYIDDEVFNAVYLAGDAPLQDAMDLAFLCGLRPGDVLRLSETNIRDDAVWIVPGKTARSSGKKLRIRIEGHLAETIDRIRQRKSTLGRGSSGSSRVVSLSLAVDEVGREMTAAKLDSRFEDARKLAAEAAVIAGNARLAEEIRLFQFRDLRAKAATEVEEASGMESAQNLLGHADASMTKRYVRHRKGKLVSPAK